MNIDWKNTDWGALLHSQVAMGSIVAIISGAIAITGHALPADQQTAITNGVTQIFQGLGELATVYALFHRVTAQPENASVIVPKKNPDQPATPGA